MKFKKIIAITLSAVMIVAAVAMLPNSNSFIRDELQVSAADYTEGTYGDLTYKNYGYYVEITGCDTSVTEVKIPSEIDGIPVTRIQRNAFYDCKSMESISIPESVHSIRTSAFYNCKSLKSITLPSNIKYIDGSTFLGCSSLEEIEIPEGVVAIGSSAFRNCISLKKCILSEGITSIGDYAFSGCTDLSSIKIPESVITIGDGSIAGTGSVFSGCSSLTEIKIPEGVKFIDMSCFRNCDNLESLIIPQSVTITNNRVNISGNNIKYSLITTDEDKEFKRYDSPMYSNLYTENDGSLTRVEFYSDFEKIFIENYSSDWSVNYRKILNMELPLFGGFYSGEKYNFLVFGQEYERNYNDFGDVEVLRIVKYSKDWERLDSATFKAYFGEDGIDTTVPFRSGSLRMTEKNGNLFLHSSRQMLQDYPHQGDLTVVVNEETMGSPDGWVHIPYTSHSFGQFVQADENYTYYVDHGDSYPRAVVINKCTLPGDKESNSMITANVWDILGENGNNYTGVSVGGFELSEKNCLIVGNSVDQSDEETFDLNGIRNIFLTVTSKDLKSNEKIWLTNYTEDDNTEVRTPHFTKVNDNLFLIMWESVYDNIVTTSMVTIDDDGNLLSNIEQKDVRLSDCHPITDTDNNVVWYTTNYKGITNFYKVDPTNLKKDIETSTLTLTKPINEYDPLYIFDYEKKGEGISIVRCEAKGGYGEYITEYEIPKEIDGLPVTEIAPNMMTNYPSFPGNKYVTKITLPDTITKIGEKAFAYCPALTSINIPDSVTSIGEEAFYECSGLTSISIPESVDSIADSTFYKCESLKKCIISESVTSIGDYAFSRCSSLESIEIPDSVTYIGKSAFAQSGLESVSLPKGINEVPEGVFSYCTNLKTVAIPDNVKIIKSMAFINCTGLKELVIPNGVTTIEDRVFEECDSLVSLTLPSSVSSIGYYSTYSDDKERVTIYGYSKSYSEQYAESNNIKFTSIGMAAPNDTYNNISCDFDEDTGILTLSGSGHMNNYSFMNTPWYQYKRKIHSVIIEKNIRSISSSAFLSYWQLEEVSIPEGMCKINTQAFLDCGLTSVTLPESLEYIGEQSFGYYIKYDNNGHGTITRDPTFKTIYGYSGSVAEAYALDNDIEFIDVLQTTTSTATSTTINTTTSTTTSATTSTTTTSIFFSTTTSTDVTTSTTTKPSTEKTFGDVNNDGIVNLKDVVIIRRYIAGGWNVEIDETNADINGDGIVNLKDVVLIRRYIVGGWNVTLH